MPSLPGPVPAGLFLSLLLLADPAPGAEPAAATSWKWTPEAVVDTVAVSSVALSPDGASVVFSRSRPRPEGAAPGASYANLWRVPFEGGNAQRLTTADGSDSGARFSPDGRWLAFASDRGSAGPRLYLLPTGGGESEVVSLDKHRVREFAWSPDGATLAYVAEQPRSEERERAERAGRDEVVVDQGLRPRRLWLLELASREVQPLASLGDESVWAFDWAPDGRALVAAVSRLNRTDDSYLGKRLRVLPRTGEGRDLAPVIGKLGEVRWSPDGRSVAWLGGVDGSDPSAGSIFVAPVAGGARRNLTGAREETCSGLAFLPDGALAATCVQGTRVGVFRIDPASGERRALVAPGVAALGAPAWSRDGRRLAFVGSTSSHPAEVFVGAPGETPRRLVDSNPQLQGLPRAAQESLRYKAGDGLEIEGVLVKPAGFREGRRWPLVVIAHGGPEAQYLDGWHNSYADPAQALAERGFLVLLPNYRGSTGRGVAFAKADHGDLGGREFEDVLDGVRHLAGRGWVDPARVGLTGGSYGGYFTALGVTRYSEHFAAGAALFGISNWESFLGQTDIPLENAAVHWNLSCHERPEVCRAASPVAHVARARTPTLILQGEKDLRVPRAQSDELYAALRLKGVPVEYVTYPREEHGLRERAHRLDALTRLLALFERHLRPGP